LPHPLGLIADTWADLQQVVCDYYLLVDVVGTLEVQAETPCLKVLLAHVSDDCSLLFFPCGNAFSQAPKIIRRELNPDLPWRARLRLLRVVTRPTRWNVSTWISRASWRNSASFNAM